MATVEEVVDKFSGMVTPSQAQALIASGDYSRHQQNNDVTNVQTLLEFIEANKSRKPTRLYTVSIKDTVYRIFNPIARRRMAVLGREGTTAKLSLTGRLSDSIDAECIERGDTVVVRNAVLDIAAEELKIDRDTTLSKVSSGGPLNSITDYTVLKDGMRNIDLVGKVIEIGQLRHVSALGTDRQVPVIDCTITDNRSTARLSLLDSSAMIMAGLHANDIIKVEFCNVRLNNGKIEAYASPSSRLLSGSALAVKLG